jgi:hypothetical protein
MNDVLPIAAMTDAELAAIRKRVGFKRGYFLGDGSV